jgi:drug/metabolite transporter (DMT)-like permease
MLRRHLGEKKIHPLTITHVPNLIGHPIGLIALAALGLFVIPTDPLFFLCWSGMIIFAAVVSIFSILGLLETKFFTTQVIGSLGFVSSSVCAAIFLKESLNAWTIFSLGLAVVGVILFSWKREQGRKLFSFDRGMVFVILAVLLSGFSSVLYKLATFHVSSYEALLTGRFITDLIVWTMVWIIVLSSVKKNPGKDLILMLKKNYSWIFTIGVIATTFIDTMIFYKLSVTTISILGTIAFPVMYFISYFKYKERITPSMWLGTLCTVSAIIIFITLK